MAVHWSSPSEAYLFCVEKVTGQGCRVTRLAWTYVITECIFLLAIIVFTARCTLVQSAVLRSHVVCLSVCLSVCL